MPRIHEVLPSPSGYGLLQSIPGAPNGTLSVYKPNLWNPGYLGANLVSWHRADVIVTATSNRVSSWAPVLTATGPTLAQSTGAAQPLLTGFSSGMPAVLADAANVFLSGSSSLGLAYNTPLSVVLVVQVGSQEPQQLLTLGTSASQYGNLGFDVVGDGGDGPTMNMGGHGAGGALRIIATTPLVTGTIAMLGFTYDGATGPSGTHVYVNGVSVTTTVSDGGNGSAAAGAIASGNILLGDDNGYYAGTQSSVSEFWIAKSVMTPTDMTNAYQYFTQQV